MADYIQSYKAKGVLSLSDMELTETNKNGCFTHDIKSALERFEGRDIVLSITYKEEVEPKDAEAVEE